MLHWNRVSIFPDSEWTRHSTMELYTDASATIGCGAVFGRKWLYGAWLNELSGDLVSIQWKELFPTYAACFTWGAEWHSKRILFHIDDKTDVTIWTAQTTKSSDIMKIVHQLFLVTARFDFEIKLVHIEGCLNSLSGSLSFPNTDQLLQRPFSRCRRRVHHLGSSSLGWLDSKMKWYESSALALSSRRVCLVGLRHYRHFCKNSGLKAYPVSQDTLKFFITFLAEQVSFKTLKLHLAAVKLNNIELGYKDNMHKMAQLDLLLRGIK